MVPPIPAHKWLILAAALLILGGILAWELYFEYNTINVQERERLATQAKVIDENLDQQLTATNHALDSIRRELPTLKAQKNGTALLNRLQSMRGAMPSTRAITIFDANGTLIARSPNQFVGQNFSNRGYFQAARQGGNSVTLYVAPPFLAATGEYVLNVSKVLLDDRGVFAGVILVSLGPEYFRTLLKSVLYAPDMLSTLIHGDGKVVFRVPDPQGITGIDLAARPGAFFTQHMKSGQMTSMFEGIVASTGEVRLTFFRTLRSSVVPMDKPLVIVVSREMTTLFAPWRNDVFVRSGLFVLLILATTLGMYSYQQRQRAYRRLVANQEAEHKRADEALRESEKAARKLAQENELMAQIGKIVSSTLDVDNVYKYFVEEIRKFIPIDRVSINLINPKDKTGTNAYISGTELPLRKKGDYYPIAFTITEEVSRTRRSVLINEENYQDSLDRFPGSAIIFQAGLRSLMASPLISKDEVIGAIHFGSAKPNSYTDKDLNLAEKVGSQIAGAIANAQLYLELNKAEEEKRILSERLQRSEKMEALGTLAGGCCPRSQQCPGHYRRLFGIDH